MTTPALNARQMAAARAVMNARSVTTPLYNPSLTSQNAKHNLNFDFGYPETGELSFAYFYEMFRRNGLAAALVRKTVSKTWQDMPALAEDDEAGKETKTEEEARRHFAGIRFWQALRSADERSLVGKYGGVIFQLGDGGAYSDPVERVPGGIEGLVGVIPAWEGQLEVSAWNLDAGSPDYGKPAMFRFNESSVDPESGKIRSFTVHPDRCYVWSRDGTTWGESRLESCYNALMDIEKVRGAGGEGFWKNAKAQPVLQAGADVDFNGLAAMLGTDIEGLPDALDDLVGRWSKGFDQSLVTQQMDVKTLPVALPQPQEFVNVALQEVAASWPIPQKILVGMQSGERASTEDAREWAQTIMSRRDGETIPNIMDIVQRFVAWGILPERDWHVQWADLTAPTLAEKLEIVERMARANQAMQATGDAVFTDDEMREVAGYDPIEDGMAGEFLP
jgi:hypothetical protein